MNPGYHERLAQSTKWIRDLSSSTPPTRRPAQERRRRQQTSFVEVPLVTVSLRVMSAGDGYRYIRGPRSAVHGDGYHTRDLDPKTRYYTGAGTPPGTWLGWGVAELGRHAPAAGEHSTAASFSFGGQQVGELAGDDTGGDGRLPPEALPHGDRLQLGPRSAIPDAVISRFARRGSPRPWGSASRRRPGRRCRRPGSSGTSWSAARVSKTEHEMTPRPGIIAAQQVWSRGCGGDPARPPAARHPRRCSPRTRGSSQEVEP